jgi:hypothetical protein
MCIWNGNDAQGYRVAVRWTLSGHAHRFVSYAARERGACADHGMSHHHIEDGMFHKRNTPCR